ncbi:MAG: maturase [Candidatus Eisenbacteria sp.]|nr:maturase [Candidatus Eisenbacteria bacterium]
MPVSDGKTGRSGKARGRTPDMNISGKPDSCIVPEKQPNKGRRLSAEAVEGRRLTKGNTEQTATLRTQSRTGVSIGLLGVREAARKDKKQKFTALLHHVTVDLLWESYYALSRKAAPGVDGMTWQEYGKDLEARLCDLHDSVHRGTYRAKPSRRTYIPKADGRRRPLGIPTVNVNYT